MTILIVCGILFIAFLVYIFVSDPYPDSNKDFPKENNLLTFYNPVVDLSHEIERVGSNGISLTGNSSNLLRSQTGDNTLTADLGGLNINVYTGVNKLWVENKL